MNKYIPVVALALVLNISAFAQTSGPSQPELQSFKPVGSTDMVNLFSGDFSYNIPLFELPGPDGGYPFNIFYNSGISMSQESSWVGLGWNLNPGAITRQMRNLPDEFDGTDLVEHFKTMEDSWSVGGTFVTPTTELVGVKFPFKANISVTYNSMTGIGIAIGGDLSFGRSDKSSFFGGIGFSSGNMTGLDLNPSIGIRRVEGEGSSAVAKNSLSLGLNLNSINGLQGLYLSTKRGFTTSFSFADKYYSPSIQRELEGGSTELALKIGPEIKTLNLRQEFRGFFSVQRLKDKGRTISIPAYGYNHLEKFKEKRDGLADFSRENDQAVNMKVPTLPIPIPTYDIYSVNTQGFNASFRAHRGNVGYFEDNIRSSLLTDKNIDLEGGIPAPMDWKVGTDLTVLGSFTSNPSWNLRDKDGFPAFQGKESVDGNTYFEPYYYKVFGENTTMDASLFSTMYDDGKPGFIPVGGNFITGFTLNNTIKLKGASSLKSYRLEDKKQNKRIPRTQVIQDFKNSELNGNDDILKYFDFDYYTVAHLSESTPARNTIHFGNIGSPVSYNDVRSTLPRHHTGGFEVIKEDGTRYIFALPVYVHEQLDVSFNDYGCVGSNGGSDCPYTIDIPRGGEIHDPRKMNITDSYETLEVKKIPKHASSYLLTAILGPDYVDKGNDGITDDDLGYWVKFTYVKTSDDYKWKAPFYGANFILGQESKTEDNMGVFSCGSREVWYLLSAETSTHIAEFSISVREDARGAGFYLQNRGNSGTLGARSYKLDKISLYTKTERFAGGGARNSSAVPVQSVHFNYSQQASEDLCKGIDNASGGRGKLTLKSLYTGYRNNIRGQLNPYVFYYGSGLDGSWNNAADNPDYSQHAMDRWGNYQPDGTGRSKNYYTPYTRQDNPVSYASVWNLKQVKLPSGSLMEVSYEPKDYGYVQNRVAAVMRKIVDYGKEGSQYFVDVDLPPLPDYIADPSCNIGCKEAYIRTVFKDETQLFFRLYLSLDATRSVPQNENVSAYSLLGHPQIAIKNNKLRIYIEHAFSTGITTVHPFQNAVYNYIKGNRLDLFTSPFSNPNEYANTSGTEKIKAVAAVLGNIATFYNIFLNVERRCQIEGFGNIFTGLGQPAPLILQNSYIRVPVLDGKKYGSGARVKSISVYENADRTGDVTGTVYDYSTTERIASSTGTVYNIQMSSGVAENEPDIGCDENAIRSYEKWANSISVFSSVSQFTEAPYNASFYPGPSVGYSKVTVRSLATDKVVKGVTAPAVRTTGQTVHEFYTAKDFPVEVSRTLLIKGDNPGSLLHSKFALNLPYVSVANSHLIASQGFSIELNDMHGKAKKVSYYAQDVEGKISGSPYSWQETIYHQKREPYIAHGMMTSYKLNNTLPVMCSEGVVNNKIMGLEVEEFIDLRRVDMYTASLGGQINVDVVVIPPAPPAPVPSGMGQVFMSQEKVALCVTNKVISRQGIVEKVIAYDQGAYSVVKNEAYDELMGTPVLVSTIKTDHPDHLSSALIDKTYKYDIQGHWIYEGMDGTYKNVQHEVIPKGGYPQAVDVEYGNNVREYLAIRLGDNVTNVLKYCYPGDELLVTPYNGKPDYTKMATAVVISVQADQLIVETISGKIPKNLTESPEGIYFKVIRPGRRNMVGIPVSTIISASNPLLNREQNICK